MLNQIAAMFTLWFGCVAIYQYLAEDYDRV